MPKPQQVPHSRYSRDAVRLLGLMIRNARIERQLTAEQLAERAGVSRGLVQRVEKGDLASSIGAAFELAAIVGVPLFDATQQSLTSHIERERHTQSLLPRTVHLPKKEVMDDF